MNISYNYWRVSKKSEMPAMVVELSASENSSCDAHEKKITAVPSISCVNCISSINVDFLLLTTPQKPSKQILQEKYRAISFNNQQ